MGGPPNRRDIETKEIVQKGNPLYDISGAL